MSLIADVKRAARITNTVVDDEVERLIAWAQAELVRAGVPESVVNATDNPLIKQAIISGALTQLLNSREERQDAQEAFDYQRDVLRKRKWGD